MPPKKRETSLILHGINALDTILSFWSPNTSTEDEIVIPEHSHFDISSLMKEKCPSLQWSVDPRRNPIKYWPTQNLSKVVANTKGNEVIQIMPMISDKNCWWCRHEFLTLPIGCPISFKPPTTFDVDGIFCSFPCVLSYILEMKGTRYAESQTLLGILFNIMTGSNAKIPTAPSWKLLINYGGHLTIDEFRDTFGRLEYTPTINIKRATQMLTHSLIEEEAPHAKE